MAAQDITAQAQAWAEDETGKQCFGETFGVSVSWGPVPVPTPGGQVIAAGWHLLVTTLSPAVGEGHLFHLAAIGLTRPKEADVRREVAEGIRKLRVLAHSKTAMGNGKALAAG